MGMVYLRSSLLESGTGMIVLRRLLTAGMRLKRTTTFTGGMASSLHFRKQSFHNSVVLDATLGEICGVLHKVFGEYRPETFV